MGFLSNAHVRTRCFHDTLAGARLGEASHLVSGPAQGRDVEHSGAFKDRGQLPELSVLGKGCIDCCCTGVTQAV